MLRDKIVEILEAAVGVIETGNDNNDEGGFIDKIQRKFGLNSKEYCAMFGVDTLEQAGAAVGLKYIGSHTASSQGFFEAAEKLGATFTDKRLVRRGDILIYKDPFRYTGHLAPACEDYVNEGGKEFILTIEANVPNSDFGLTAAARAQQGVWKRIRILPAEAKPSRVRRYLRGFVNVEKLYE